MVRQWQELFWDGRYSHVDMGDKPDWLKLADAYGIWAKQETDKSKLVATFKEAIEHDGPALVDVRVTKEENTYPMIPAGQAARDMVG
jgi:acetolactate synthase-1/2/3 large subunit